MLYFSVLFKAEHIINEVLQIFHIRMFQNIVACRYVVK
jgi:hypothetical protein